MSYASQSVTVCFTDTETTNLAPKHSCIIQIAAIKVKHGARDPIELRVLSEWEQKLQLSHGFTISEKVAKLNGYDPDVWAEQGQDRRHTMIEYCKLLEWSSFGGQNPQFDYRHIEEELGRQGLDWPKMSNYSLYSVDMLARPLVLMGLMKNVKQATMCEFFGLEEQTHDALDDIRAAVRLYQKLLFLSIHGIRKDTIKQACDLELDLTPTSK